MILMTTIRVFSYARHSGVSKCTLDIALLVKSNMAAIFSRLTIQYIDIFFARIEADS